MKAVLCAAAIAAALGGCSILARIPEGILLSLCEVAQPSGVENETGTSELRLLAAVSGVLCADARRTGTLREIIIPADHKDGLEVARRLVQGQEFFVDGKPGDAARNQSMLGGTSVSQSLIAIRISPRENVRQLNRMDPPQSLKTKKQRRWWAPWRR